MESASQVSVTAAEAAGRPNPPQPENLVLGALEPDQLVAAKKQRFSRRMLGRPEKVLMWGLRGYVVFMVVVVAVQIVQGLNGGGS